MKSIIDYLDKYLTKTGKSSIDPVEANSVLTIANLLPDNKIRPGKPLRDLLRKGKLPYAFQPGGKGTSWVIPYSSAFGKKMRFDLSTSLKKGNTKEVEIQPVFNYSSLNIDKGLMNPQEFKNIPSIENLVPNKPGIYCIRIKNINKLSPVFKKYAEERAHNIIYIGIAAQNLYKRLLNQELGAKGHGTFFRSIGAVLGFLPLKGSLNKMKNKYNYKFSNTDEKHIMGWISKNLTVNWIEYSGDFKSIETELILKYKPLFNISNNPYRLEELTLLRTNCLQIANTII
ncbi:MAG: hypothetical protein WCK67_08570 [bacterium]